MKNKQLFKRMGTMLLASLLAMTALMAQTVTVQVNEAGGLWDTLEAKGITDFSTVKSLKVSGTLGDADYLLIKNLMSELEDVDLSGTSITEMPEAVFRDKKALKTVRLPEGMTSINHYLFECCGALSSVTFGSAPHVDGHITFASAMQYIGGESFDGCVQLTHLDFSKCTNLNTFEWNAFSHCYRLQEVQFPSTGNIRLAGGVFNLDPNYGEENNLGTGPQSLTLTKAISQIEGYCLPPRLTTLFVERTEPANCSDDAFDNQDKDNLTIYVPVGTKKLYAVANGWTRMYTRMQETGIKINISGFGTLQQDSRTYTDGSVLFNTQGTAVTLKGVPEAGCELLSVKLNGTAVSIGSNGTFTLPAGSTTGTLDVAFSANMLTIDNPNGGELYSKLQAMDVNPRTLRTLKVTGRLTATDWSVISGVMKALEAIDLSETSVTAVPDNAFKENKVLKSVILPTTVVKIGNNAFQYCDVATVEGCDNVTEIGEYAFDCCSKLKKFPFGDKLQSMGSAAFFGCSSLPEELVMPATVVDIGWWATFSCSSIRRFDLSQCVLNCAFHNNTFGEATSVILPEKGSYQMHGDAMADAKMTELVLPANLTYLGERAMPETLKKLFVRHSSPTKLEVNNESPFSRVDVTMCELYVPKGTSQAYSMAKHWADFMNIKEYGLLVHISSEGKLLVGTRQVADEQYFFPSGSNTVFSVEPNAGWMLDKVMLDDDSIAVSNNQFTLTANQTEGELTITFRPKQYNLQLTINGEGQVKLGEQVFTASTTIKADSLSVLNFTLEPAQGLVVSTISYNGQESVVQNGGKTYVTPAITANATLAITFAAAGEQGDVATYIVSTGDNGTIEYKNTTLLPQTTIAVKKGEAAVFTFKPDKYYAVDKVRLNGTDVTTQLNSQNQLTIEQVDAPATLEATFRVNAEIVVELTDENRLSNLLSSEQRKMVTKLTVSGPLYDEDFWLMRDEMPQLAEVDLWQAQREDIPSQAFCVNADWDNAVGKRSLKSIRLPEGVHHIGWFAFASCTNLSEVNFSELKQLESIEDRAFQYTALHQLDLSNTRMTEVGSGQFYQLKNLVEIRLPQTLERLNDIYRECNFTEVDLSHLTNLKTLNGTFYNSKQLQKVVLPEGLTTIMSAFQDCTSLTSVNIPKSVTTIGESAFWNAGIQRIDLSGHTNLTTLGGNAFIFCRQLQEVLLPASLVQIGGAAFNECTSLKSIDLSNTQVEIISGYTFNGCYSLENVKLPETLTSLGDHAFSNTKLGGIFELPRSLTYISALAFENTQIAVIKTDATLPPTLENASAFPESIVAAFVPEGSAGVYKEAPVWEDLNIMDKEVHADVTVSSEGNLAIDIMEQAGVAPALVTHLKVHGPLNATDFAVMRSNMTLLYDLDLEDAQVNMIPDNAFLDKKAPTRPL